MVLPQPRPPSPAGLLRPPPAAPLQQPVLHRGSAPAQRELPLRSAR